MKYPILYKSNETDFFAMGLGPIQMSKATVTQERNGIFIFEGEILTDSPLFPLVLENYIIKADADHLLKDQRFRIKRIVPNHSGKAQIYAEHVSYLSRELTIKPEVNITGSAQVALSQWKASIVESNPFVVSSDITTSASTKWRIDKVENPMMALGGVEGSILDRWGGEYLFDNYHISLLKKRGKTATNILAYGRNITDFEQERNILSTYTSIAPYAIYTNDREKEIIVTVDGFVVDSEHVNKFPNRVTKPIDFSSEFGSDEIPTKARLTTLAQQYIKDNEIGVPTTSIKISFLDLSQTADYADYAFLEQVNLCDDVRVHYPKLGVNTIAKVVRVVWNCLTESYDEIEIGQKRMSLASQIQEQNKVIQEINTQTNHAQVSADGKNMIFYGLYGENGLGQPTATKIGDTWFKPSGLETEMLIWTGVVWTNPFLGGDNIADEAITGTKIANATIGSAKIINVDAYKITVGILTGHTINSAVINGGTITGTSFFNSGADGDMSIANGRIRAKDFFVDAEGSLTSLTSYVVVRSNQSHVFLQPAEGYGVSVTKIRTAGGIGNFMPITASAFRGGNTNAVFESLNGYTVVRSSGDSQPVYLQGDEIRATSVSSAGNYVAVRASAFPTGSMEAFKTDIKPYANSALKLIRESTVYDYKLKSELANGRVKTRIGLVIGQGYSTPEEIIDGDGIEQYAMNSLGWKAIQELDKNQKEMEITIWQLKNEIESLKGALNE